MMRAMSLRLFARLAPSGLTTPIGNADSRAGPAERLGVDLQERLPPGGQLEDVHGPLVAQEEGQLVLEDRGPEDGHGPRGRAGVPWPSGPSRRRRPRRPPGAPSPGGPRCPRSRRRAPGFSRNSTATGRVAAASTIALSAVATRAARSAVEGASPRPPRRSDGPRSVEMKAWSRPACSGTGAGK